MVSQPLLASASVLEQTNRSESVSVSLDLIKTEIWVPL
jgi:hypothetical protein